MAAAPPAAPCGQHRRRAAVAGCSTCGNPVCADCLVHTPVGIKCRSCTTAPRSKRQEKKSGNRQSDMRRRWGAVALALGAVVLGGVAFTLLGADQPDDRAAGPVGATADARDSLVAFTGADGLTLRGTLRVPQNASVPSPSVVIIPGFGPTHRDGVAPPGGPPDPLYRDLSQAFAEAGVASLRYDKRGTGQSPLPADQALDFDDMVDDAAAALTFLAARAEVNPNRVALAGHDEGGLTALRVAAATRQMQAVVLVSTPGRPLADVLADDLVASADEPSHGEDLSQDLHAVVEELLATRALPAPDDLPAPLRPVFPPGEEAYLQAIFSLDPAHEAARVDVPALIVRGGRDPGASQEDVDRLTAALGSDTDVLVGHQAGHTLALQNPAHTPGSDAAHDRTVHDDSAASVIRDHDLLDDVGAWLAATLGAEGAPAGRPESRERHGPPPAD